MKKLLTIPFLLLCILTTSSQAAVLTFDDITTNSIEFPVDTYGGLTWNNLGVVSAEAAGGNHIGSGYDSGTVSGDYVGYNGSGYPLTVSGSAFNFIGAYLTGAWNDGLSIDIVGNRSGIELYSQTITIDSTSATWFEFNFLGIDELIFTSYGGTDAGYGGGGVHFAMDDFTYSPVPVPAAVWLFGSGILGLVGFSKRKITA